LGGLVEACRTWGHLLAVTVGVAAVHRDQGLLLGLGQSGVGVDRLLRRTVGTGCPGGTVVEHARFRQQRGGRHAERLPDGLQHLERGLVQAPLDLAQVRVRHRRQGGQLAQG
jgi:hypothetical protein